MTESRGRGHSYVGTEHVLLGILRLENDLTSRILHESGVTYERVLAQILKRAS
jgi:ATP-dependent Clp protease ATP-binding subunit ClpC